MALWWISDETARRTGNNAKMNFLSDDNELRETVVKVIDAEKLISYDGERKRQPVIKVHS